MKSLKVLICTAVVGAFMTSCSVTMPYAVTSNPIGSKTGTSSTGMILGVIQLNKNHGVAEAAKNGGITGGISTVDVRLTNYLLFWKRDIIVTGE